MIIILLKQKMSTSQIARKRLNSLKVLTESLKDHTKNTPLDLSHIKQILNNSKQLHTSNSHRPPLPDNGTQNEDLVGGDSNFKPLFTPKRLLGKDQFNFEEEVVKLRQENIALEQTILTLRDQIIHLQEQKSKMQKAQQSSNTQYFKLSETLEGFVGRLNIPSDSYDRLQYSSYEVELKLDKIMVFRKEKSSLQQFQLTSLKQAEYCSGNVLVLRFQEFLDEEHKNLTNVFLKFYSEEHLHKWDLALFANYHIVNSLSESRLFQKYFRCLKLEREIQSQREKMKNIKQSEELDPTKQKDLLKLLIQKRQQYLEVKKLIDLKLQQKIKSNVSLNKEELQFIEPKLQPISESLKKMPKQQSSQKPNISSPIQKIDELEPHQQQSQQVIQPLSHGGQNKLQIKHTESNTQNTLNIREFPSNPMYPYPDSKISTVNSQRNVNSSIMRGNFPLSPPPFVPTTVAQSQLRESKASIVNQLSNVEGRTISYESSSRNNSASKFKQMGQQKLNNARVKLQSGYYATKYSKDGFSPHQKKVFLSLDCRKLCWSERDKSSEYKSVPIAVIIRVDYGIVGQGITKHVKDPDSRYFCVIEYYTSEYKKKTIQLGSGNMQDIKDLSSQLSLIIQSRQVLS